MIDFSRGHTAIVGRTRSGKTYTGIRRLQTERHGVLFVNTQHEKVPAGFVKAYGSTPMDAMLDDLASGAKINFLPSFDRRHTDLQLSAIVKALYDGTERHMILAVDEAHLRKKEGLEAMMMVATTGLRWGITLVPITQRLAKLDNDLMTQCVQKVVFATEDEDQYFKGYGYPIDEINRRLLAKGQYSYCVYYSREIEGAYKL